MQRAHFWMMGWHQIPNRRGPQPIFDTNKKAQLPFFVKNNFWFFGQNRDLFKKNSKIFSHAICWPKVHVWCKFGQNTFSTSYR